MLGSLLGSRMVRRQLGKLSPRHVATVTEAGRHSDGGGLYLVVAPSGAKRWAFIFRWKAAPEVPGAGRMREMGLGSFTAVPLARAREKAAVQRALLDDGKDPIAAAKPDSGVPNFGDMADAVIATRSSDLRNDKSKARWRRALETYAAVLRPLRVDAVQTDDVLGALKPIWTEKPETAQKTRGYIEAVLDAAKAKGHRTGENPARWRGHLDHLLPRRPKLTRGHHAALPYEKLPGFVAELRARSGAAPLALEFLILTAARTSEVREATWAEIDLQARVWTVPGERMKGGREHRVPLSTVAVAVLGKARAEREQVEGFVFPGHIDGKPLSNGGMERVLDRMKVPVTVHGFRSTFRDWTGESTSFPREVAEAALAHTVGDETERAYRRADALEKRRKLMEAWAGYSTGALTRNGS